MNHSRLSDDKFLETNKSPKSYIIKKIKLNNAVTDTYNDYQQPTLIAKLPKNSL